MSLQECKLYLGDCLSIMKNISAASVDLVLTDPPYGTTACKWDSVIPLKEMWCQLKRIIKPTGVIALMAAQPFTTILIHRDRKSTRLNSSHIPLSRMPSSA